MSLAEDCDTWARLLDERDECAYQKLKDTVTLHRAEVETLIRILRDARDVIRQS